MSTVVWTVLAIAAMLGIFGACVIAVVMIVRVLERVLARRRAPQRMPSEVGP
jgi:hypothetical protein